MPGEWTCSLAFFLALTFSSGEFEGKVDGGDWYDSNEEVTSSRERAAKIAKALGVPLVEDLVKMPKLTVG